MKIPINLNLCRPFGGRGEGDSVGAELFHAQVTRAQGLFSLRQVIRCWAIDYLAANIASPCVVLHYPSEREFVKELKKGGYEYVGINFVVATFHKARRMAALVRKFAPNAKIIFGGYGTVLPDELLKPFSDFICREEGIGFMRRLLGESACTTIEHPYAPIPSVCLYSYQGSHKVAHLTAGLGCPNACDFCCTSHFFKRRYVPFLKGGRAIFEEICAMEQRGKERGDNLEAFIIIDEDFFLNERRAREFLQCVRESGKRLSLMGFGSVRGLSQFTADEIAEMGFATIWTAFEGEAAGYRKLQGKTFEELYSALKSRGVAILSSMIIGFPYQNKAIILKEFDRLMALRPSLTQILIYFAFPGTPFHELVVKEGRYLPEYQENPDLRRWDGFSMHFKHAEFCAPDLEALQKKLYREDFKRLGPSIVRLIAVWLEGYKNLKESENVLLKTRADHFRQDILRSLPAIIPAVLFGPTQKTRADAWRLFQRVREQVGKLPVAIKLQCFGSPVLAGFTWLMAKVKFFQQPGLLRVEHRLRPHGHESKQWVDRLQGGFHANPLRVFAEDFNRNAKQVLVRMVPQRWLRREKFCTTAATRFLEGASQEG